ncbi:MAG: response regulator transcription factor [Bacteroidetes bacterium]|nr:response regulator transcription factor [Bacteroidota bacterium]
MNIWVVEDNAGVREGIRAVLELRHAVRTFETAEGALRMLELFEERPDVLLLDLGLPGMSGLEALRCFRVRVPGLCVVVLTVFDDPDTVFRALCEGASGYLLKSADLARLCEAVEEAHQGGAPLSPTVAAKVLELFRRFPVNPHKTHALTEREREVLRLLADGLSKRQIALQLKLSPHTVDTHLRAIYGKLHVHTNTAAVARAIREGLI